MAFVRSSKYRHVFGTASKQCYTGIRPSGQGDRNFAGNSSFLAIVRDQKVFLLAAASHGRYEENQTTYIDSKSKVWEVEFSLFDDRVLAVGTESGDVNVYVLPEKLPEKGDTELVINEPYWELVGEHFKKIQFIVWHPTADYILASGGADYWITLWNVQAQTPLHRYDFDDVPYDMCWNMDGSLFAVTYNNKNMTGLRVIDPRTQEVLQENPQVHEGTKSPKVVFLKNNNIITIGSDKKANRAINLWKAGDYSTLLTCEELGSSSGVLNYYYDSDLGLIYTFVKGEGTIKYYEIKDDNIYPLSMYSSTVGMKGGNFLAKRCVNAKANEIARFMKLEEKQLVPVSLTVPRKSEHFQDDIYPDCCSDQPACTAEEWIAGKNVMPNRMSLKTADKNSQDQRVKVHKKEIKKTNYVKSDPSDGACQASQNNYAPIPEGIDLQELLEDMKKVKATVRKLNKRVSRLEAMQEQVANDDEEEEEEE